VINLCERCEEEAKRDEIIQSQTKSASKHSSGTCSLKKKKKEPEVQNINRESVDPVKEMLEIENKIKKQHQEAVNGYDNQIQNAITDIATFSAKMILMFEDYKQKGDTAQMVKILHSMKNYAMLTGTESLVLKSTIDSLVGKMQGAG
jgi:hypothetical protein